MPKPKLENAETQTPSQKLDDGNLTLPDCFCLKLNHPSLEAISNSPATLVLYLSGLEIMKIDANIQTKSYKELRETIQSIFIEQLDLGYFVGLSIVLSKGNEQENQKTLSFIEEMGYERFTQQPVFSILAIREVDLIAISHKHDKPDVQLSIAIVTKITIKDKQESTFSFESSIIQNNKLVQGSEDYKSKYGNLKELVDRYTPEVESEKDETGEVNKAFWYTKIFELIGLLQTLMGSESVSIQVHELAQEEQINEIVEEEVKEESKEEEKKPAEEGQTESYIIDKGEEEEKKEEPVLDLVLAEPKKESQDSLKMQYEEKFIEQIKAEQFNNLKNFYSNKKTKNGKIQIDQMRKMGKQEFVSLLSDKLNRIRSKI